MSLVSIKNLYFSYKSAAVDVPIFKNFSLNIEKGDFIAIKGPSGSGKSTLLYLIAGLLKFDRGEISFKNRDISQMSDFELSLLRNEELAFIFQQFHLLPRATVLENIILPCMYPIEKSHSVELDPRIKAKQLAKQLGIEDRLEHTPNQLSGGQQQRVAIARALINNPKIILADEPTGNLDSKSTLQIIEILKDLHSKGKTIILITHEDDVARAASRVFHLRDGKLVEENLTASSKSSQQVKSELSKNKTTQGSLFSYLKILPMVIKNSFRNKSRSILTMLGITVGVAAVCSMVTLGNYTKDRILDSYADLGVNTIVFRGYPNWQLKATDQFPLKYRFFNWEKELIPLKKIFSDIKLLSPNMTSWDSTVSFAGKSIEKEARLKGVSADGLAIQGRKLIAGRGLSTFHIERKHSVCVIGYEIAKRLFSTVSALNQVIHVSQNKSTFACKVIGVLESKTSNNDWAKPNLQVFVPFTLFQAVSEYWWTSSIKEITIQLKQGSDVERVGKGIKGFFEKKYGKSGKFRVDSDSILVAQMQKFLNLFSILLAAIAMVTLTVGGIGIANMMLVSVSERLKEIGLRKSVGATNRSIRYQFLFESVFLCSFAGAIGVLLGIAAYQSAIYGASLLIDKLEYEWIFDPFAIGLSFISIIVVGIVSGIIPALKAEKLQVIEALRSE